MTSSCPSNSAADCCDWETGSFVPTKKKENWDHINRSSISTPVPTESTNQKPSIPIGSSVPTINRSGRSLFYKSSSNQEPSMFERWCYSQSPKDEAVASIGACPPPPATTAAGDVEEETLGLGFPIERKKKRHGCWARSGPCQFMARCGWSILVISQAQRPAIAQFGRNGLNWKIFANLKP